MFSQDIGFPALSSTLSEGLGCYGLWLSTFRGKRDPQPAARLYRVEGGQESLEQGSSKAFIFVPARFQQSPYVEKERCPGASNKTLSSPPTSTNAVALHECCKGKWDERKQKGEEDKEHGPQMLL